MNTSDKNGFREAAEAIRKAISPEEKSGRDEKIAAKILRSEKYERASMLLLFAAVRGEPDMKSLAQAALSDGKTVAYPACGEKGVMKFRSITSLSELKPGKFGIPEPSDGCQEITVTPGTLCIVPGLCFSPDGKRIGYGAGYYDRFFETHECYKIGVTYKELVFDRLPQDGRDIKMDEVVSG